jgi:hypothetical protein
VVNTLCFILMPFGKKLDTADVLVALNAVCRDLTASANKGADIQPLHADKAVIGDLPQNIWGALLHAGVLMVWVNDRQITPEAARSLRDEVRKTVETLPPEQRKSIDQLMHQSLQNWRKADPNNPDHRTFLRAGSFVDARPHCHVLEFES